MTTNTYLIKLINGQDLGYKPKKALLIVYDRFMISSLVSQTLQLLNAQSNAR